MKTHHVRVFLNIEINAWIKARTQINALRMFDNSIINMGLHFEDAKYDNSIIKYECNFKDDNLGWHHHIVEDNNNENN